MEISLGNGKTKYGTGVQIDLTGEDLTNAIYQYLEKNDVYVDGAATIRVDGELCRDITAGMYVDPSANVTHLNKRYLGSGKVIDIEEKMTSNERHQLSMFDKIEKALSKKPFSNKELDFLLKAITHSQSYVTVFS